MYPEAMGERSPSRPGFSLIARLSQFWAYLFLALLLVFFAITAEAFVSVTTLQTILVAASITLVVALGQTVAVLSAGIDLSVGYTVGMAAVVEALLIRHLVTSVTLGLALVLAVAFTIGLVGVLGVVNGAVIAWLGIPPFIMTLGMYGVAEGIAFLLSGGPAVAGLPTQVGEIGNGYVVNIYGGSIWLFTAPTGVPGSEVQRYIPNVVLATVVLVAIVHFVVSKTRFGRHVYAIGGNVESARRSGIPVRRRIVEIYALSAMLAACAGTLSVFRFQAGQPTAGQDVLLDSLAAVVIGGTSLFGGRGSIPGAVVGTLIIAVLQTGLILLNVAPFWQYVAVGVVIILAVMVDQARVGVMDRVLRRREIALDSGTGE